MVLAKKHQVRDYLGLVLDDEDMDDAATSSPWDGKFRKKRNFMSKEVARILTSLE